MADDKEREIQLQFLDEAQDHLQTLESVFMGLSGASGARIDSAALNGALRAAHSMKGGGSLMGFPILSQLAHRLEDGMKVLKIQRDSVEPDDRLEYLLLSAVDCLRSVIDCNLRDVAPSEDWLAHTADPIFDELHDRLGDPAEEDAESVLSPEDGADILPILFETEVEGCLKRIEDLLATDDKPCLREELLILAQELGGLGAMLQLDAFCHLCASIAYALQADPTRTLEIAHIAVAEWRRSQSLVLTQQLDLLPQTIEVPGLDIRLAPDLNPTNFLAMMSVAQSGENEHHLVSGPNLHEDVELTQAEFRQTEFTPFGTSKEDIIELDNSAVTPVDLTHDDDNDSHWLDDIPDTNDAADSEYQDLPDDIFSTAHGISFHIRNSENALAPEPPLNSVDDSTDSSDISEDGLGEDSLGEDGLCEDDLGEEIIALPNNPKTAASRGSIPPQEMHNQDIADVMESAAMQEVEPLESISTGNLENVVIHHWEHFEEALADTPVQDQDIVSLTSELLGPDDAGLELIEPHEPGLEGGQGSDANTGRNSSLASPDGDSAHLEEPDIFSELEALLSEDSNPLEVVSLDSSSDLEGLSPSSTKDEPSNLPLNSMSEESNMGAGPTILENSGQEGDPDNQRLSQDSEDGALTPLDSMDIWEIEDAPQPFHETCVEILQEDNETTPSSPELSSTIETSEEAVGSNHENGLSRVEINEVETDEPDFHQASTSEIEISSGRRDGLEIHGDELNSARPEIAPAEIDQAKGDDDSNGVWTLESLLNDFASESEDSHIQDYSAQELSEIENVGQWIDDQLDVLAVSEEEPLDLDELLAMPEEALNKQKIEQSSTVVESVQFEEEPLDFDEVEGAQFEEEPLDFSELEATPEETLAPPAIEQPLAVTEENDRQDVDPSPDVSIDDGVASPAQELTTLSPTPTTYMDEEDAIATWDTISGSLISDPAEANIIETSGFEERPSEESTSIVSSLDASSTEAEASDSGGATIGEANSGEANAGASSFSTSYNDDLELKAFSPELSPVESEQASTTLLPTEPSIVQASGIQPSPPAANESLAIADASKSALKAQHEVEATEFQLLNPTSSGVLPADENENTFVRVGSKHLNQLNDLFGELTIDRNGLTIHLKRLRTLVKTLNRRVKLLDQANSQLRSLYDQGATDMIADQTQGIPSPYGWAQPGMETTSVDLNGSLDALELGLENQFDSLEMDNYSDLHHLFQSVMEGMVQIQEVAEDLDLNLDDSEQSARNLNKTARQLQIELMHVRMRPLSDIASRFPRALRELSLKHGKPVEFKLTGGNTLIDRTILDSLGEPLMHLVRNAFDHGIEDKAARQAYGKPEVATIEIRASHQGNRTIITISDDGQGIALDKIRKRARQMGLDEMLLAAASEQELLSLIFEPGFSTAAKTTDLSGRGVGMDVVRDRLQHIHGDIKISTRSGQGTTFTLSVPMTLSVTRVLLAESNGMLIAIPTDTVDEMIVLEPEQIMTTVGREVFEFDGKMAELIRLKQWLQFYCPRSVVNPLETAPSIKVPSVLIVRRGNQITGIEVEQTWSEQEVTVRRVAGVPPLPDGFSSCTILGDGRVVPLVNIPALLHWIVSSQRMPSGPTLAATLDRPSPEGYSTPDFSPHAPNPSYLHLPAAGQSAPDFTTVNRSLPQADAYAQASSNVPHVPSGQTPPHVSAPAIGQSFLQSPTGAMAASNPELPHSVILSSTSPPPTAMPSPSSTPSSVPESTNFARPPHPTTPDPSTYYLLNQRPQILIVDDSIAVRRLLALTLEKASYRVEQAKDGQDALEKLNTGLHVDAMICDIEMPRLDGYRLLAKMKANARLRHVPVMMLTSRSGEKHRKLAMSLGAIAYFTKPYNEQLLVQRLSDVAQISV